ncbi:GNAT family N-acetyltransferase [Chryseomicrobium sp. FSL W7-1435]|uniref:GNAT family N-acetyltransferase n=1 Tax=Chryseomicrobium sp. FSL W7-1435 TaxID=2921704 RepID=UPI00315A9859
MAYEIKQIPDLNTVSVQHLVEESEKEGYRFLTRLVKQYKDGSELFQKPGEALFGVWKDDELVGLGGILQNAYADDPSTGRLRRFYVTEEERRNGVGTLLLDACLDKAKESFKSVTCRTDSAKADAFYRQNGFVAVHHSPDTTHRITF